MVIKTQLIIRTLADCEVIIQRGLNTFIDVGNALLEIRDNRLYKDCHATFEDYCKERWDFTRQHAYRLMEAAEVAGNLSPMGDILPATERQARPLTQLEPEQQREVWGRVTESGDKVTASRVQEEVDSIIGKAHVSHNSGNNEWYTPSVFIEAARAAMGSIDIDPASSDKANEIVLAESYFTKSDDGRLQKWHIHKWLNPSVCSCGVQPNVLQWKYEKTRDMLKVWWDDMQNRHQTVLELLPRTSIIESREKVLQMLAGIAEHGNLLLEKNRNALFRFVVQGLCEGIRQVETSEAESRPGGTGEASNGETEIQSKRKRQSIQAQQLSNPQLQAEGKNNGDTFQLDYGNVGDMPRSMESQMRILSSDWPPSARPLYSLIASRMSGDYSRQYNSCVLEMQCLEGKPTSYGVDKGQASICPNCGATGFSGIFASSIWMNPPYAQPLILDFCELLVQKYRDKEIQQACVLVNNATETVHYQHMMEACSAICFIKGRVKFVDESGDASGAPLQGQSILYFGLNQSAFAECFSAYGVILYAK